MEKRRTRFLAALLSLLMLLSLFPVTALATTGTGTEADPYVVASWTDLKKAVDGIAPGSSAYIQLSDDIVESSDTLDCIDIRNNIAVTIDMNGHKISYVGKGRSELIYIWVEKGSLTLMSSAVDGVGNPIPGVYEGGHGFDNDDQTSGHDESVIRVSDGGELHAENIIFTKNTSFNGGAVHVNGTAEFTNCEFTANHARKNGGAVYIGQAGEAWFTNCKFSQNTIGTTGGGTAIYSDGGYVKGCGKVHIEGGSFEDNISSSSNGAAVYVTGELWVNETGTKETLFSGNAITQLGSECGSCICAEKPKLVESGNIVINNVVFRGNKGSTGEKSCTIFVKKVNDSSVTGYDVRITNSTFTENENKDALLRLESCSSVVVEDCTFTGNKLKEKAPSSYKAAICRLSLVDLSRDASFDASFKNCTMTGNVFADNATGEINGKAVPFVIGSKGTLTIEGNKTVIGGNCPGANGTVAGCYTGNLVIKGSPLIYDDTKDSKTLGIVLNWGTTGMASSDWYTRTDLEDYTALEGTKLRLVVDEECLKNINEGLDGGKEIFPFTCVTNYHASNLAGASLECSSNNIALTTTKHDSQTDLRLVYLDAVVSKDDAKQQLVAAIAPTLDDTAKYRYQWYSVDTVEKDFSVFPELVTDESALAKKPETDEEKLAYYEALYMPEIISGCFGKETTQLTLSEESGGEYKAAYSEDGTYTPMLLTPEENVTSLYSRYATISEKRYSGTPSDPVDVSVKITGVEDGDEAELFGFFGEKSYPLTGSGDTFTASGVAKDDIYMLKIESESEDVRVSDIKYNTFDVSSKQKMVGETSATLAYNKTASGKVYGCEISVENDFNIGQKTLLSKFLAPDLAGSPKTTVTINAAAENFTYGERGKTGYKDVSVDDSLVAVNDLVATYYKETATAGQYETTGSANVPTNAGNYKVVLSVPETNDTCTGSRELTFTITKAAQTLLSSRVFTTSYDGNHNPVIALNTGEKREDNSAITYEVSADKNTILGNLPLTAGDTYYVRKGGDGNYNPSNWVAFTVPAQAQYTVRLGSTGGGSMEVKNGGAKVNNNTKVYTGTVLTLSATPANNFGFTAWYANDVKLTGNTYTVTGDVTLKAVFTRTGYDTAVIPTPANFTYDGSQHTGFAVPDGAHYTATGTLSATNAGVYSVTFKLNEGCLWEDGTAQDKALTWKISKASQAKPTLDKAQVNTGGTVEVMSSLNNLKMVSPSGVVTAATQNTVPEQVGLYEFYYAGDANHYPSGSALVKVVTLITVKTQQPTDITKDSAVLHGTVTGTGAPTSVSYEYGKTGTNDKTTVANGSISGLTADTEYSYRAFVTVNSKTYYGETVTFRTAKELKKEPTGGIGVSVELPKETSGTLSVESGNTVIKSVGFTSEQNPTASFDKLSDGYYNVVLRVEDYVETRMIAVTNGQVQAVNFFVPEGSLRTIVEIVNPETPKVAVEGLGSVIEAQNQASGTDVSMEAVARGEQDVEVSLNVEKNDEAEGKDSINYALGSGEKLDTLLDISLLMTVSNYEVTDTERSLTSMEKQDIGKANQSVLEIVIPYATNGSTTMYRYHDGVSEKLTKLSARPVGDFVDGTYYVDNGYIFLYASGFSTYAIAETESNNGGHGGHGGGSAVISAPTGDAGLALYAALSVSSMLGMGWVGKKKRDEE